MGNLINLGNIFSGTDSQTVNDEFKMTIDRDDLFAIKKSIQYQSELLRNNHGMNLTICKVLNEYLQNTSKLLVEDSTKDEMYYLNNIWSNFDRNIQLVEKIESSVMEVSDYIKRIEIEGTISMWVPTFHNLLQHCQKTKRKWHKPSKFDDRGRTYFEVAISNMKRREKFNERLQLKLKLIQKEKNNDEQTINT